MFHNRVSNYHILRVTLDEASSKTATYPVSETKCTFYFDTYDKKPEKTMISGVRFFTLTLP